MKGFDFLCASRHRPGVAMPPIAIVGLIISNRESGNKELDQVIKNLDQELDSWTDGSLFSGKAVLPA